jgi:hypothetical protein
VTLRPRQEAALWIVALSVILIAAFTLEGTRHVPSTCIFHAVTGLPCASCGMTRAFIALGHGRFADALALNIASPVLFATTWILFLLAWIQALRGQALIRPLWIRTKRILVPATLFLMASAWALNLGHLWVGR